MSSRSLNQVELIGNLTRDPELRYTPTGAAVCALGLATNRTWTTESGEKKEETEFHRVVAWNKLAELCSQLLTKGRKIYVRGRLRTNSWTGADGAQRSTTEVVIEDMIILDSRRPATTEGEASEYHESAPVGSTAAVAQPKVSASPKKPVSVKKEETEDKKPSGAEDINPDDIPF